MTAIPDAPPPTFPAIERFRLDDADWQTYEKFLAAIGNRPIRCTYDRGRLEIMAPLRVHEHEKKLLGDMVQRIAIVRELPFDPCGSMTIRREDLQRGFEPDECFYIEHAAQMQARREPDFLSDPPPDLAIEVDITSSSIDRQSLYEQLGVPELWRLDREGIEFLLLKDRAYRSSQTSRSFPFLTTADVNRYLAMLGTMPYLNILAQFETWLRSLPPASGG